MPTLGSPYPVKSQAVTTLGFRIESSGVWSRLSSQREEHLIKAWRSWARRSCQVRHHQGQNPRASSGPVLFEEQEGQAVCLEQNKRKGDQRSKVTRLKGHFKDRFLLWVRWEASAVLSPGVTCSGARTPVGFFWWQCWEHMDGGAGSSVWRLLQQAKGNTMHLVAMLVRGGGILMQAEDDLTRILCWIG